MVVRKVGIALEIGNVVAAGSLAGCLSRQRESLLVLGYVIVLQEELGREGREIRLERAAAVVVMIAIVAEEQEEREPTWTSMLVSVIGLKFQGSLSGAMIVVQHGHSGVEAKTQARRMKKKTTHHLLLLHFFLLLLRLQSIQRSRQPSISKSPFHLVPIFLTPIRIQTPRKHQTTHLQTLPRPLQRRANLPYLPLVIPKYLPPTLRQPLLRRIHLLQHRVQAIKIRLRDAELRLEFAQQLGW